MSNYTANDIVSLSAGRAFREKIGYSKYLIFDDGNIYSKVSHKNLKTINQAPTIGIIVCKKKNGYLFKYVTNKKIYEREYELV